jgi:hypothetical protein
VQLVLEKPRSLVNFGNTTPILRIFDEAKAREFYVGFHGFAIHLGTD